MPGPCRPPFLLGGGRGGCGGRPACGPPVWGVVVGVARCRGLGQCALVARALLWLLAGSSLVVAWGAGWWFGGLWVGWL